MLYLPRYGGLPLPSKGIYEELEIVVVKLYNVCINFGPIIQDTWCSSAVEGSAEPLFRKLFN